MNKQTSIFFTIIFIILFSCKKEIQNNNHPIVINNTNSEIKNDNDQTIINTKKSSKTVDDELTAKKQDQRTKFSCLSNDELKKLGVDKFIRKLLKEVSKKNIEGLKELIHFPLELTSTFMSSEKFFKSYLYKELLFVANDTNIEKNKKTDNNDCYYFQIIFSSEPEEDIEMGAFFIEIKKVNNKIKITKMFSVG